MIKLSYLFKIVSHLRCKQIICLFILLCISTTSNSQEVYTLLEKWVDCGKSTQLLDPYYSEGVSFKWTGSSKSGKANGFGIATKYINGELESTYEGHYKNGIREGKGKFTHIDGSVKTGTFVNGQLVGYGTMTTEDGHNYEGEFLNYRMHGKGILRLANGTTFDGFFVSDVPYTGKTTYYTGDISYIQEGNEVERINAKKSGYTPKLGQRVTEYFDENWNRCQPKSAAYYRLITYLAPNKPKGVVKDYYITGELQSEQYPLFIDYDDEGKTFLEGEQIFYHKNGKISGKRYYYNNHPNGPVESYYTDGTLESVSFYSMGTLHGDAISYYPNGEIQTVAKYSNGELYNNKFLQVTEDKMTFLVYNEDFQRNKEAWEYKGQNGIVQVNNDGTISLQASPERTVSGGIYTGFLPSSENIISIVTNQRNPGQAGISLLFGFKDWDNFCAFSIYGNQYQFAYKKNGVMVQNDEWKLSKSIKPDINHLQVVNAKDKIIFYINDEAVAEIGRIYYDGSFCGISIYNGSEQAVVVDAAQLLVQEVIDAEQIPEEYLPSSKGNADEWSGNGSGFFLNEKGYIATNYHVIENAKAIQVTFTRNGQPESYPATVVVSDKQNDLAIIKIDGTSFKDVKSIPYGLLSRTKDTGSEVFAMGYPIADVMGTEVKFTDGKISSKSGLQGDVRVYQITVPIQPGNSGGPLFDMQGNVVGITSSGLNRDYFKSENVNYAIKASYLKTLFDACPETITLTEASSTPTSTLSLTDKIKLYEDYVVLIRVK